MFEARLKIEGGYSWIRAIGLPVVLFGAGLPQVAGLAGDAKSYAARLFDYPPVDPLDDAAARELGLQPQTLSNFRVRNVFGAYIGQTAEP